MVDVEHKALEILKMYINDLHFLVNNLRDIVSEFTYIESWTEVDREDSYNELAVLILKSGKINEITEDLIGMPLFNGYDRTHEEEMFLAVVSAFNTFFGKVYDLYLLDQILYILTNISCEELESMVMPKKGFAIDSYNVETCFGIEEKQTMLYDFYYEATYQKLYGLKMWYEDRIEFLLRNEDMKRKYKLLNKKLEELTFSNDNQSFYINRMYIGLNTLISVDEIGKLRWVRRRAKKVDSDQLTFIR